MLVRYLLTMIICLLVSRLCAQEITYNDIKTKLSDVYSDSIAIQLNHATTLILLEDIICHDCLQKLPSLVADKDSIVLIHIVDSELYDVRALCIKELNSFFTPTPQHYFLSMTDYHAIQKTKLVQTPYSIRFNGTTFTYRNYQDLFGQGCK